MLKLLIALILVQGCNNSVHPMYSVRDTIWPVFKIDTTVTLDSSNGYLVKHTSRMYKVDTSKWFLFKVDSAYTYFRIFFYGKVDKDEYPVDSVKKWKKTMHAMDQMMRFGETDWLLGYNQKQYLRTTTLLAGSKISDTIPTPIHWMIGDTSEEIHYAVGGIFGEDVRVEKVEKRK